MHIPHTLLYTFPEVLTRRICVTIKSFFSWWLFSLFFQHPCLIQCWFCKEKLDASQSWCQRVFLICCSGCDITAKAEQLNPGGSVKDRAALYLIKEAEEKGLYHLLLTFFIILGANSYRPSDSSLQLEFLQFPLTWRSLDPSGMECWPMTVPPSAGIFLGCCDSLSDEYSIFTLGLKEALWEKSAPPLLLHPPPKKKTVSMALVVAKAQIHKSCQYKDLWICFRPY